MSNMRKQTTLGVEWQQQEMVLLEIKAQGNPRRIQKWDPLVRGELKLRKEYSPRRGSQGELPGFFPSAVRFSARVCGSFIAREDWLM